MLEFKAYGLIYKGDPTLTGYFEFAVTLLANPKSAILVILSLINKLAGLRSLWRNPASPKCLNPSIKSRIIGMAYYYGSLILFLRRVSRSPSLQNSVIM